MAGAAAGMSDGSMPIDGGYLLPSPSTSAGGGYYPDSTTDSSHDGGGSDQAGEHAHEITDFGIGTLVLAMCLGAASRTYLTHVTG